MRDKKKRFDQIYDLIAIRCVMETHSDVYAMLGYIHELWRPMPGRFKDYIANPKSNGYQSIHTTVYGPKGPIEIQIRTKDMHQVAEYGVAAHWAYKKGIKGKVDSKESALGMNWIKDLVELQDASNGDAKGFVDSVKRISSQSEFMSLHQKVMFRNCLKIQVLLTLPMPSIPKSARKPQVPRLMVVWCL